MTDDLDQQVADDEAAIAARAVAMLEQERAERLADVSALDGAILSIVTRLTGTREAQIEAAVAAVSQVEARLTAARTRLARARDAAAAVGAARRARADAAAAHLAEREAALTALASRTGPLAGAAQTRLFERELLRERLPLLDEAVHAGSDLLGRLNTVTASNRRASSLQTTPFQAFQGEVGGLSAVTSEWGREAAAYDELRHARAAQEAIPERAARFAAAMAAVGRDAVPIGAAAPAVTPLHSLLADGLVAEAIVWERTQIQANEAGDLASRVRNQLVPVEQERRAVQARLAALDAELDALLDR